jgi:hypothetical protein
LDAAANGAARFEIAGQTFYTLACEPEEPSPQPEQVQLLPAFDEYIIAYRDRSAIMPAGCNLLISTNGVFRPAIIKNGKVIGLWRKGASRKSANKSAVELEYFKPASKRTETQAAKAVARWTAFNEPPSA